ncbi:MAG: pitrilysin family protein [Bacteroidota bacterium]
MTYLKTVAFFAIATTFCTAVNAQKQAAAGSFSIPYEKFVLDNGLQVILHEDHSDPIIAVTTLVHVGSNREKPGKTGFAHFFEHMSFNHSENTPRGANRKLIPEWGGNRNGGTWNDGTIYYEVIPKDAFEKILWIDSDRLGFMINTVTKEALAKEIQVVKNEKRQNYDNVPYGNTNEIISSNLYPPGHPYNWTVIGSLPDLQAASLEDVKEFYERYYGAANATLVIAGDINIAKTKERVKLWFGEIRKGPQVEVLKPQPVTLSQTKSLWYEDNFARLPELNMVFPTVEQYHPDSYALDVLSQLLSGNRKSPLYKIIVEEKKLAPGVNTGQDSKEVAGDFSISVRANEDTKLQEVKTAIETALIEFEKKGFTDSDLQRIKAGIETNLYRGVENVLDKSQRLAADNVFKGDPVFLIKAAELTKAVTRDDIMRVYNKYIKGKPYVMTSFVPKGKKDMAVEGSELATVWIEKVEAGAKNEEVSQGEDAKFEKTITKHDRSEPAFGEMPLFKMPAIATYTFKNGMKGFAIESKEIPLVTFEIVIRGGHWADPIRKSGVSSLLASMMMQGTVSKTPEQLEEAIELLGANIFVNSGPEEMRIRANCLEKNFEATLALVQEILLEPRWDKKEYDRLYKALNTNIKGREANANAVAGLNFNKLMYGTDHILGYPLTGVPKTVENITLDDLKTYYNTYVVPAGAAFHLAGAVTPGRMQKIMTSLDSKWQSKTVTMPAYNLPAKTASNTLYFIDVPGAKQSVLYIGKLALSASDPNSNNLAYANEMLGGGISSRLNQVLRIGKGYTYGAQSLIFNSKEVAPFAAITSVRANATLASLELIKNMIADYSKTFTEQDVAITRNKVMKTSSLLYETQTAKLGMLSDISKYNKTLKYIEEGQQELISMQLADFKKVIDTYLQETEMVYLVVGDKATQLDEVKKLGRNIVELDIYGNQKP